MPKPTRNKRRIPEKQRLKFRRQPLFVLGLPRSGTSLLAGIFHQCGAWVGSTLDGDEFNPKGYFEHGEIRESVIKSLLRHGGCDPLGVRKLPQQPITVDPAQLEQAVLSILEADGYTYDQRWLYKDAKLTLLWPVFLQAFPAARWVICRRDRESFVNSCLRTSFMSQHSEDGQFWNNLAEDYDQRLDALRNASNNVYELDTPSLITGDLDHLEKLVRKLNLTFNEKKIASFISAGDWHGAQQ